MSLYCQFQARALIERLTRGGPTFSADDARELIGMIPLRYAFSDNAGYGPSAASLSLLGGGDRTIQVVPEGGIPNDGAFPERISQFGLRHMPGLLMIAKPEGMHADTAQPGSAYALDYDFATMEPVGMRILDVREERALGGAILLGRAGFLMPWKTPCAG